MIRRAISGVVVAALLAPSAVRADAPAAPTVVEERDYGAGLILVGASFVLSSATIYLGFSRRATFDAAVAEGNYAEAANAKRELRYIGTTMFIPAMALLLTGTILIVRERAKPERRVTVAPTASAEGGGIVISGSW